MQDLDLSVFFKTKPEASDFSIRMSTVAELIYRTDFNLDRVLTEKLGVVKKDQMKSLLRDSEVNTSSNTALLEFFTKITEKIKAMPVMTITCAIEPPPQTLQAMADWLLQNAGKQILFEIKIDPGIVGGLTISYNGKYKDYSVKPILEKILNGK
jgi:F0F1-type ATP synthase delta subunit